MLKTFDFVFDAMRSEKLMKQLKSAIAGDVETEICTDIARLYFDSRRKIVSIRPLSTTSKFHWKVAPAEMTYDALLKMLSDDWENIQHNDIHYV